MTVAGRGALWDANRLDVGDLRAAPGVPAEDVSFRSLAENVKRMLEGGNVLDLTRMVQHCVQKVSTTFSKACVAAAKHQATQKVEKNGEE
jgi:hypothetical protein